MPAGDGEDAAELFAAADERMFCAKKDGRNRAVARPERVLTCRASLAAFRVQIADALCIVFFACPPYKVIPRGMGPYRPIILPSARGGFTSDRHSEPACSACRWQAQATRSEESLLVQNWERNARRSRYRYYFFAPTGIIACSYGVPAHIMYGFVGSGSFASVYPSVLLAGPNSIRCGPVTTQ